MGCYTNAQPNPTPVTSHRAWVLGGKTEPFCRSETEEASDA